MVLEVFWGKMNIEKFCIGIYICNVLLVIGFKVVLMWFRVFEVYIGCLWLLVVFGSLVFFGIFCRKNILEIMCFVSLLRNYINWKGYVIICIFFLGWCLFGF